MTPYNPFHNTEVRDVIHEMPLAAGDIDFLLHRLHGVAAACLNSPLQPDNHLELQGVKVSPTHNLSCNLETSGDKITRGSISIASNSPPSSMLLSHDANNPFWSLVSDQGKVLTNSDLVGVMRQLNPALIPAHAFPLGMETTDSTIFSLFSDKIKPYNRKIATKVFGLLDIQGIEDQVLARHGRLTHSKATEGRSTTTNISLDRWHQLPLFGTSVDVGYQLINSEVGRRKESLIGRVIFQSGSEFLEDYARNPKSIPNPLDFAANMVTFLDDLEKQVGQSSARTFEEWR